MSLRTESLPVAERTAPPGMIVIPAGSFPFGARGLKRTIGEFAIDRAPMTNAYYLELARKHGLHVPQSLRDPLAAAVKANHPVVGLTWREALAAARAEGFDLPTEEEWEKAARGADGLLYPWGDTFDSRRANTRGSGRFDTSPVDAYPDGASPYGVLDLAGNVWEWTSSRVEGGLVRIRGGSWFDPPALTRNDRGMTARAGFASASMGFRRVFRPGPLPHVDDAHDAGVETPQHDWMELADLMHAQGDDLKSLGELEGAFGSAVAQASEEASRWEASLNDTEIESALGAVLVEDAAASSAPWLRELEESLQKGDLKSVRMAIVALERTGAPTQVLDACRAMLANADDLASAKPAAERAALSPKLWWWILAALAVANGALVAARWSGRL